LDAAFALLAGLAVVLDAGLPFEGGVLAAFIAAALFTVAFFGFDSPVTAFLAGAFFTVLAFLAGFFAVVLVFPVVVLDFFAADVYFLGVVVLAGVLDGVALVAFGFAAAAGALAGFSVVVVVAVAVGFLVVVVFLVVVLLALAAGFLLGGLVFSLAASLCPLPASLTLPEGPFGRTKTPFSAPWAMALLSWLAADGLMTT